MNKIAAVNYITPPPRYLWCWADDGTAVDWTNDATACLWIELHALLNYLAPHGLPPVGSVIMILMACQGKAAVVFSDAMKLSASSTGAELPSAPSRRLLLRLKEVLECVQALPAELRTGLSARAHLLRTLFEDVANKRPEEDSRALLEQVDIWGIEDLAKDQPSFGCGARLLRDLKAIAGVYERRDLPRLEPLLRTGLEDVDLQPATVPEPAGEEGESSLPLLRQLEEHRDTEVAAIAGLARRMVAMFALPRPTGHPQELPVGGISDITNRGPLDRLLPGELAHDDLTLTARLANNEALFYRRDTPPDEPATERVILMDTGIHLWGTPRIFALAAVLALQAGAAEAEGVRILVREGAAFRPLRLDSVAAARNCLTILHAEPDPEEALSGFALEESSIVRPDVFFVSIAWQRETVRLALHELALRVGAAGGRFYILTISRTGALELSIRTASGTRILSGGRIDPDTIFRSPPDAGDKPAAGAKDRLFHLPEIIRHLGFYRRKPMPFRFPEAEKTPGSPQLMGVPVSAGFDSSNTLVIRASGGYWELPVPHILFKNTGKAMLSSVRPFTPVLTEAETEQPDAPVFYAAEWNADCRLIFDSRGVLHAVFHDMHGPVEFAVLCLLDKATAAWVHRWPEGKQHLGAKAWFHPPETEGQSVVHLTPLMQRFSFMARSALPLPIGFASTPSQTQTSTTVMPGTPRNPG